MPESAPRSRRASSPSRPPGERPSGVGYRRYRYPWREGNRFELLVDGKSFFPAMLAAIRHARERILLEIYLFESGHIADRFIEALVAAARRGVSVALLLDDFGAAGLVRQDRQRMSEAGIRLAFYNPLHYGALRRNLFRDHRKLLVVDSSAAFVGGAGITDQFDAVGGTGSPWHEIMVRISGPCVADWQDLFAQNWNRWASPALAPSDARVHALPGGSPGRVTANEPSRMEIKRSLIKRLRTAERRIWLATAYFIPSRKIRRALRRAARRGVDVRLLLPGPHTDNPPVRHASRRYYYRLLRHGIRIYEYQPRFLHAKVLVCDDWVSLGSSNVDRWNLRWNLEANQEVVDPHLLTQVERLFTEDFLSSWEVELEHWVRRPWYLRLAERFWGIVEQFLERLSQHRRGDREL